MITGNIITHFPLAPSLRISIVEINMPKKRAPLNADSGPPAPYATSPTGTPLLIGEKQPFPPIT